MKVEIDFKDVILDIDGCNRDDVDLEGYLVETLVQEAFYKIKNNLIERNIVDTIKDKVCNMVNSRLNGIIEDKIMEIAKEETIKIDGHEMTIKGYVESKCDNHRAWRSFEKVLINLVDDLGEELKKRYDLMFASQLITKLKELDMLKPGVDKILLCGNEDEGEE